MLIRFVDSAIARDSKVKDRLENDSGSVSPDDEVRCDPSAVMILVKWPVACRCST